MLPPSIWLIYMDQLNFVQGYVINSKDFANHIYVQFSIVSF